MQELKDSTGKFDTVIGLKDPKRIELPRGVWIGPKVISRVPQVCSSPLLGESALVVSDPTTFELVGSKVERKLGLSGFKVMHTIIKESDAAAVTRVRGAASGKADFFIGVGGGRSIDVGKLASFQERKPFVSVPTAASHDGIASSRASIKGGPKPISIETHAPIAIIADTLIIKQAPHRLLAAGCGDAIANLTAVKDWQLASRLKREPYSEYAATLSLVSPQIVIANADQIGRHTEKAVRKVVEALISSSVAMAIAGNTRPASGSEHMFSHALDVIAPRPALHGEQCGVGAIMMAYLHGEDWQMMRRALSVIGAPTNSTELRIAPKYIVKALTLAHKIRPERYTILGGGLSRAAAKRLAKATKVI